MVNTYKTTAVFRCPNNSDVDIYEITIKSEKTIQVELILETLNKAPKNIYQEDLATWLKCQIGAFVTVAGWHQGVHIASERL
jgi:hypothetical protein